MRGLGEILNNGPNGAVPKSAAATPNPAAADPSDETELPEPGGPYLAYARAAAKPLYTLHCLLGKEGCRSFQYVQLDSHSEFRAEKEGQIIKLRFVGSKIWEVTISGLNLWRLYDGIHRHVTSWVRQSD